MKHSLALVTIVFAATLYAQSTNDKPILGFTSANAAKEHALEAQFDAKLSRDDLRNWKTVTPSGTSDANRIQWIDNGPPKTQSFPSNRSSRYYRVIALP